MWKKRKINQRTSVPSVRLKGKSQGESQRIHQRSDSHCTDRFYTWFYRGCVISRHPGGIPGRICACDPGNDLFSMGAELSMTPMGEHVGGSMLRTKKLGFIIIIGFILGFIITISEPDLQVLAEQVSSVPIWC